MYEYDPDGDILVLTVCEGTVDHGQQEGDIILHFSEDDTLLQVEILDASRTLAGMLEEVLQDRVQA